MALLRILSAWEVLELAQLTVLRRRCRAGLLQCGLAFLGARTLPHPTCHRPLPKALREARAQLTKASVPMVREDKAKRAEALEAPGTVGTGAKKAEVGLLQAFVDVWRGRDMSWE